MAFRKRTLSAFVSSTYRDLRATRRIVGEQLVGTGVLPVGMEIFPAAGAGPWEIIRTEIETCDFYVLIVAGCYGSLASAGGGDKAPSSWTKREYEYARELGKPILALIHGDPSKLPSAVVDDRSSPIWDFRELVQKQVLARLYENDADLIAGLHQSLLYLRNTEPWDDTRDVQLEARTDSLEAFLSRSFDRSYDLAFMNWSYQRSSFRTDRWDASCQSGRVLRANWPEGLSFFGYNLSKPSGDYEAFFEENPPAVSLNEWERSDSGEMVIRDTCRRMTRSSYTRDFDFRPALGQGEVCSFRFSSHFPAYRFAYREDVIAASVTAAGGRRDFETQMFKVNYPIRRLVMSAFLPTELRADNVELRVYKNAVVRDRPEEERVAKLGAHSCVETEGSGGPGKMMTMDLPDPVYKRTYEFRWRPPLRSASPGP
jgi:uncharacterized protein DUF4062